MSKRTGVWVVTTYNMAQMGRPLSVHRSHPSALRAARKVGGQVEYASVVAAVQAGSSYTDAIIQLAGSLVQPVTVEIQ